MVRCPQLLLFVVATLVPLNALAGKGALDGTSCELTRHVLANGREETGGEVFKLSFDKGLLKTLLQGAPMQMVYNSAAVGKEIRFRASLKGDGGTVSYQGAVKGTECQATIEIVQGKKAETLKFRGTARKRK